MSGIHTNRDRADSFGTNAERYDRTRPSYPTELVDWLSADGTGTAIDVGCGTGQLTRLLRDAGWAITGVEADARMATVARSHGLDVDVATFEAWPGPATELDLICSAQAWHWIDPTVGYAKAATHLVPGGMLAMLWNGYHHSAEVLDVFRDVYGRLAPSLLDHAIPLGTAPLDHAAIDEETLDLIGPHFADMTVTTFAHQRMQSIDDWTQECMTHSGIALLPEAQLSQLLDEQHSALVEAVGQEMSVRYTTRLTSVRRV